MVSNTEYVIEDDGTAWMKCAHPRCSLQLVRPGKTQCDGECDQLTPAGALMAYIIGDYETSRAIVAALDGKERLDLRYACNALEAMCRA